MIKIAQNSGLQKLARQRPFKQILRFFFKLFSNLFPLHKVTRLGVNYNLDLRQIIDGAIYLGGWEPSTISFLQENVNAGDVVVEVGANIGAHTLIISKLVGKSGRVYAFEPTEYAHKKLIDNLSINEEISGNTTVIKSIVTNELRSVPNKDIQAQWKISRNRNVTENLTNYDVTSIDQYVEDQKLSKIDMLKIDVDGYDFKVLSGARKTIKKFKPIIFIELCEYTLKAQGDSTASIVSLLFELGYNGKTDDGEDINSAEHILQLLGPTASKNGIFTLE